MGSFEMEVKIPKLSPWGAVAAALLDVKVGGFLGGPSEYTAGVHASVTTKIIPVGLGVGGAIGPCGGMVTVIPILGSIKLPHLKLKWASDKPECKLPPDIKGETEEAFIPPNYCPGESIIVATSSAFIFTKEDVKPQLYFESYVIGFSHLLRPVYSDPFTITTRIVKGYTTSEVSKELYTREFAARSETTAYATHGVHYKYFMSLERVNNGQKENFSESDEGFEPIKHAFSDDRRVASTAVTYVYNGETDAYDKISLPATGQDFLFLSGNTPHSLLNTTTNLSSESSYSSFASNTVAKWSVKRFCLLSDGAFESPSPTPPLPPLDGDPPMPTCCPPPAELGALIKKVNRIYETLGCEEYPAKVPASLIDVDEGWLGELIPNPEKEIKNLTQFFAWGVERFDEILGQFEIPIQIKDSDPTTPGDQPKGLKLTNVAEAIGEITMMAWNAFINTESLINITTRSLLETGADKQQNYATYMAVQAIMDYLGFSTDEKRVKMPMLFTPGKDELDQLLQETEVNVTIEEFNENQNFQAVILRLQRLAAIVEAQSFRKIDVNGDIKQQLMDTVKGLSKEIESIGGYSEEVWEQFKEDIEGGYSDKPGVPNPGKPYGKDRDERPQIIDLEGF